MPISHVILMRVYSILKIVNLNIVTMLNIFGDVAQELINEGVRLVVVVVLHRNISPLKNL